MDLSGTNGEPDLRGICSLAAARKFEFMRGPFVQQGSNDEQEIEKAPFLVVQKIREAILDETFKPGERLPEEQVGKMFNVSRSPVREALLALGEEGTGRLKACGRLASSRGCVGFTLLSPRLSNCLSFTRRPWSSRSGTILRQK